MLAVLVRPAAGHTDLESTDPAFGSTVDGPVREVRADFVSAISAPSAQAVILVDGAEVEVTVEAGDGDRELRLIPTTEIDGGEVGVAVEVLAADGHRIDVDFGFVVDEVPTATTTLATTDTTTVSTVTTVQPTTAPPTLDSAEVAAAAGSVLRDRAGPQGELAIGVARLISYLGTGLLIGAAVLSILTRAPLDGWARMVTRRGSITLSIAAVVWAGLLRSQSSAVPTWPSIGFGLQIGAGIAALVATTQERPIRPLLGAGLAAAVSYGLVGHALTSPAPFPAFVATVVHVAAVGVWIGGLAMVLAHLAAPGRRSRPADLGPLVGRYSRVAMVAVPVVAVSGLAHLWIRLEAPGDLLTTDYGRVLTAKLAVVAVVLALGGYNSLFVVRSFGRPSTGIGDRNPSTRLHRIGRAELAFALLVLALTTLAVASAGS